MHRVEFEVGEHYENRRGKYQVLAIDGDVMQIRWKSGGEVTTTVTMQSRILNNIKNELEHPVPVNVPSPRTKRPASSRRRWSQLS